jgi:beta-glucosidase
MCAYNRYEGEACCGSNLLLEQILRKEWGFKGYVVSDCWAVADIFQGHKIVETPAEAAALAVKAGTDLNCGSTFPSLGDALSRNLISEAALDQAVRRLFEARFRLGMFDPPERVPYARIPYDLNNSLEHKQLALEAARKSIVLLKNDGNQLPLKKDLESIAVIGPNADDPFVLLGNYNGTPERSVTALEGIRRKVGAATRVYYARGCDIAPDVPPVVPIPSEFLYPADGDARDRGLTGEYYSGASFEGRPVFTRVDPVVSFIWRNTSPISGALADSFSVRWEGLLRAPESGAFRIGANGLTSYKVFLDGEELVSYQGVHHPIQNVKEVELEAGRFYSLRIEYLNRSADPQLQLVWSRPAFDEAEIALGIARKSDVIVFAGGLSPQLEGEEMPVKVEGFLGGDRTEIRLPRTQEELLKKLVATGKTVVLLLLNGSALATVWADENVPAILTAWYPGQSGGDAIGDVLFGDYNPAGRLPVTYYRSLSDLPPFESYEMTGRTYRYFGGKPLYPFGHGLSYSQFEYGNLRVSPASLPDGGSAAVSVDIRNSGAVKGEEVVQVYVTDLKASVPVPLRSLAGFSRVELAPGQSKTVNLEISPAAFAVIDSSGHRVIEPGDFLIAVGGKQPGFEGNADARTTGVVTVQVTLGGSAPIPVP